MDASQGIRALVSACICSSSRDPRIFDSTSCNVCFRGLPGGAGDSRAARRVSYPRHAPCATRFLPGPVATRDMNFLSFFFLQLGCRFRILGICFFLLFFFSYFTQPGFCDGSSSPSPLGHTGEQTIQVRNRRTPANTHGANFCTFPHNSQTLHMLRSIQTRVAGLVGSTRKSTIAITNHNKRPLCVSFSTHRLPQDVRPRPLHKRQKLNLCPSKQCRFNSITASTDGSVIPDDVKNLTLEKYHETADATFEILLNDLDAFFEQNKIMEADVDEEAGVMQINCSEGTYVINKQPPTKQIWLSSPISGPKRFDLHNDRWICLRDNVKFSDLLKNEMNMMYSNFEWSQHF